MFVERNIQHGKDRSITNERCIIVQMFTQAVTNTKLKTQQNLQKKKHANVCFVLKAFVKNETMEDHYWEKHIENFTWIKCKLGCSDVEKRCLKIILSGIIF